MAGWFRDARLAGRQARRAPGFTAVAVTVLALGIGANTAIFSVMYAVMLKPLPFPHSQQLVEIKNGPGYPLTGPNFLDLQRLSRGFQSMALYTFTGGVDMSSAGSGALQPEHVAAVGTEANFFEVLGVQAQFGRTFARGEDQPGRDQEAVLSYGLWQAAFAGERAAVGRAVELQGQRYTVIGVMPRGFRFPADAELWVPQDMDAKGLGPRGGHQFLAIGRLDPGVSPAAGLADLQVVQTALDREYPSSNTGLKVWLEPLHTWVVGRTAEQALLLALGAVALVLLIACADVANLLLARAAGRQREMAVRMALGASRTRLVRQLLTESILLALAGSALGVALASGGVKALMAMKAAVPQPNPIAIAPAVLGFTVALALVTGLLFGLAPAWQMSRPEANEELKGGSGATLSAGRRRRRLSDALVVGETAVSVVLLIGAGLLLRSFVKLETLPFGARQRGVLTAKVDLPSARYPTPTQAAEFARAWLVKVRSLPGVASAAITSMLPLEGGMNGTITLFGRPTNNDNSDSTGWVEMHAITSDYFRTLGIPLVQGRELSAADLTNAVRVDTAEEKSSADLEGLVISCDINQEMAAMFWPGKNPIGQKFSYAGAHGPWLQVVGVVGNTRQWGLDVGPRPEEFEPWDGTVGGTIVVAHTRVPASTMVEPVRRALAGMDPDLVLYDARTMQEIISQQTVSQRFVSLLIGVFAGLALLLAAAGIYGVMSYLVAQRTREIGIRMALGADRRRVVGEVVGHGMSLAGAGIALGVAGALVGGRGLKSWLFGITTTDWVSLTAAAAILAGVALLACWLPGRRAARVDPAVALRAE